MTIVNRIKSVVGAVSGPSLALVLALGTSGCAFDTAETGEEVASTEQPLSLAGSGHVGDGFGNSASMTIAGLTACFLTQVSGRFRGTGEWVQITNVGGRWTLESHSLQGGGIAAHAMCVNYPMNQNTIKTWQKGQGPVALQKGGSCFLTTVQGEFAGGGEHVDVWKDSNEQWWVGGASQAGGGLRATAGCFDKGDLGTFTNRAKASWDLPLVSYRAPNHRACFLRGIQGDFNNGTNVEIRHSSVVGNASGSWLLHGDSKSIPGKFVVGGTAGCAGGADFVLP